MWIPRELYERTVFEIGLPKNVRREFATQDFYPYYSSCGYPTSGSLAFPLQFDQFVPRGARCGWGSSSGGGYPWMVRSRSATTVGGRRHVTDGGMTDERIPGTALTKSQLNDKVMAQIMQSEMAAERHDDSRHLANQRETNSCHLANERETNDVGVLKKSVSFADFRDAECWDLSDSGHGSQVDVSLSDVDDDNRRRGETARMRDAAVGTRSTPGRPRTASPQRRAWRYWNNEPSPSLHEPMHVGPYREGPYRDCIESVSVLLRDAKKTDYNTGHLLPIATAITVWTAFFRRTSVAAGFLRFSLHLL